MANTEKKITKTQKLEAIKALIANGNEDIVITVGDVEVGAADIVEYCDTAIAQLAKSAERNKAANEKKKNDGDALTVAILGVLGTVPMSAEDIIAALDVEDLTKQKVSSRLATPVKDGTVIKEVVKENKTQKTVYRLA